MGASLLAMAKSIYYTYVAKTSISSFRRVGTALRLNPTNQDRFALRQLLWPDYSTTNVV